MPHTKTLILFLLTSLGWALPAAAVDSLRIVALFEDKAMVEIDGVQRLLKKGEPSPEGVVLISADFEQAVIEMDGEPQTLGLSDHIGGGYKAPQRAEIRLTLNASGAYMTEGRINGNQVALVVDTGATQVAMNETTARKIGLDYRREERKTAVQTASGVAIAYNVSLDRVAVGPIELTHIPALVVEGNDPPFVLLGMSFLSQLEMEHSGSTMVLRTKH